MRRTLPRHVRVRHMGRTAPGAVSGPRSLRHQAAVLCVGWADVPLRLGAEGHPGGGRVAARSTRRRSTTSSPSTTSRRRGRSSRPSASCRPRTPCRSRRAGRSSANTGISSSSRTRPTRRPARRGSARCCAKPSRCTSMAWRPASFCPAGSTRARSPPWRRSSPTVRSTRSRWGSRSRSSTSDPSRVPSPTGVGRARTNRCWGPMRWRCSTG